MFLQIVILRDNISEIITFCLHHIPVYITRFTFSIHLETHNILIEVVIIKIKLFLIRAVILKMCKKIKQSLNTDIW